MAETGFTNQENKEEKKIKDKRTEMETVIEFLLLAVSRTTNSSRRYRTALMVLFVFVPPDHTMKSRMFAS